MNKSKSGEGDMKNNRKALYLFSGIFNVIVGVLGAGFGIIILLLGKIIKQAFIDNGELTTDFITKLIEQDESYNYLLEYTNEQRVDYIMSTVYMLVVALIVFAAIYIIFAVLNFRLRNGHDACFGSKRWLRHVFVAFSWVLLWFNIANITTTIAVYMKIKDGEDKEPQLYSASEDTRSWGV